jgi:ParB family chromosome partitioning protein
MINHTCIASLPQRQSGHAAPERDENTCRKDFTPSEAVAMGKAIEETYRRAAKAEQDAALARGRRAKFENAIRENFPNRKPKQDDSKRTREQVATAIGMSGRQYEKDSRPDSSPEPPR